MEQAQIGQPDFEKNLAATNLIQVNLIKKSGEDPTGWIAKHAADFREIILRNPKLLESYRKNPELVEDFIFHQLLNKKEHLH